MNTLNPNAMIGIDFNNLILDYELISSAFYSCNKYEY